MCNCGCGSNGPCLDLMFPQGDRGPRGYAGTMTVGTVTGLPYGDTPTFVNVGTVNDAIWNIGLPGGAPGDNGLNAFTLTSSPFSVPLNNGLSVVTNVTVLDNQWMSYGQVVTVEGAGVFQVVGKTGTTLVNLLNLQDAAITGSYPGQAAPGTLIAQGALISPGGWQGPPGIAGTDGLTPIIWSGNGNPNLIVGPNPGQGYGSYYNQATNGTLWTWSPGGPWVDTGIPLTGPPGVGLTGHTPVLFFQPGTPSGGADGDWSIQNVNDGLWRVWARAGGLWSAGPTLLANRLLGSSATNPNTLSLTANLNDTYWTMIGTVVTLWSWNGSSWSVVFSFNTAGGGGGSTTLEQAAANGLQHTGNLTWLQDRTFFLQPKNYVHTTPGGTLVLDMSYPYHVIDAKADIVLDYTTLSGGQTQYIVEIFNSSSSTINITYGTGKWSKVSSVTQPTSLLAIASAPANRASMICYPFNNLLNIVINQQGCTAL